MRPSQTRFVTACQQLLALGVVLAVLTPAAGIISIDVVGEVPGHSPPGAAHDPAGGATFAAYTQEAARPSRLPAEPLPAAGYLAVSSTRTDSALLFGVGIALSTATMAYT